MREALYDPASAPILINAEAVPLAFAELRPLLDASPVA